MNRSTEVADLIWRKSTRSGPQGGNCVEVAELPDGGAAVRDSKDLGGPWLRFTSAEWQAFVDGIKDGEFDRHTVDSETIA